MAETASSIISIAPEALRTLISNSATFQTWTGTANATDAKAYIHVHGKEADGLKRPFAFIDWDNGSVVRRGGYIHGPMTLIFESDISEAYREGGSEETDYTSASYEHTNKVGAVIGEVIAAAEASGALYLDYDKAFEFIDTPHRPQPGRQDQGFIDYYRTVFRVNWGLPA